MSNPESEGKIIGCNLYFLVLNASQLVGGFASCLFCFCLCFGIFNLVYFSLLFSMWSQLSI